MQPAQTRLPVAWPGRVLALLCATATLSAMPAMAAEKRMYRCQQGDAITFSEEPCGPDARELGVHYDTPAPAEAAEAQRRLQAQEASAAAAADAAGREQRIDGLEREIEDLRVERERAVEQLAAERQRGTEERADATFRERKRADMTMVIDRYNSRIEAKQIELQQLLQQ